MELISREDLLKQIEIDSNGNRGQYGDEWFFIDTIKKMPTIKKALEITKYIPRPQGEWIEVETPKGYVQKYQCSNCGYDDGCIDMNFCPHCGACMGE